MMHNSRYKGTTFFRDMQIKENFSLKKARALAYMKYFSYLCAQIVF